MIIGLALSAILGLGVFTYFYAKYSRLIDQKLRAGPFANTAKIFAAPETVGVGDASLSGDHRGGICGAADTTNRRSNPMGYYQLHPSSIEVFPGPNPTSTRKPA